MVQLIKLSDDKFNGNHPNGIFAGHTKEIEKLLFKPVVGEKYYFGSLQTSIVTEILDDNNDEIIFKTMNSTYVIKKNV